MMIVKMCSPVYDPIKDEWKFTITQTYEPDMLEYCRHTYVDGVCTGCKKVVTMATFTEFKPTPDAEPLVSGAVHTPEMWGKIEKFLGTHSLADKLKQEIVEEFIKWHSSETTFAYGVPDDRSIAEWWLEKFTTHSHNLAPVTDPLGIYTVAHGKNESKDYIRGASDQFLADRKKVEELFTHSQNREVEIRKEERDRLRELVSRHAFSIYDENLPSPVVSEQILLEALTPEQLEDNLK